MPLVEEVMIRGRHLEESSSIPHHRLGSLIFVNRDAPDARNAIGIGIEIDVVSVRIKDRTYIPVACKDQLAVSPSVKRHQPERSWALAANSIDDLACVRRPGWREREAVAVQMSNLSGV